MQSQEQEAINLFKVCGALLTNGHFVYRFGRHGSVYVNKKAVFGVKEAMRPLCYMLAKAFYGDGVETVIGPATGGNEISPVVAYFLSRFIIPFSSENYVHDVHTRKLPNGNFAINDTDVPLVAGKKFLVVEDVLTSGGSVKEVVRLVRWIGGRVIGVGALWNRGGVTTEHIGGVPKLFSLVNKQYESWAATQEDPCPLCEKGIPVNTEFGKGKEFLARKKK